MMYIGTSLGGCLKSLLNGEVSEDDVLFIITRTSSKDYESFLNIVKGYYNNGNLYSRSPDKYDFTNTPLDDVVTLASRLWFAGKIHQPRVGIEESGKSLKGYVHPELVDNLWLEIIPPQKMRHPSVKDLWEKLKMTVALTDENHI